MPEIDPQPSANPPRLEIDLDAYMPLFEDDDISEADKQAYLQAIWSIMVSFIEIGWGVHPVQQALADRVLPGIACGKLAGGYADDRTPSPLVVELQHQSLKEKFNITAAQTASQKASDS